MCAELATVHFKFLSPHTRGPQPQRAKLPRFLRLSLHPLAGPSLSAPRSVFATPPPPSYGCFPGCISSVAPLVPFAPSGSATELCAHGHLSNQRVAAHEHMDHFKRVVWAIFRLGVTKGTASPSRYCSSTMRTVVVVVGEVGPRGHVSWNWGSLELCLG